MSFGYPKVFLSYCMHSSGLPAKQLSEILRNTGISTFNGDEMANLNRRTNTIVENCEVMVIFLDEEWSRSVAKEIECISVTTRHNKSNWPKILPIVIGGFGWINPQRDLVAFSMMSRFQCLTLKDDASTWPEVLEDIAFRCRQWIEVSATESDTGPITKKLENGRTSTAEQDGQNINSGMNVNVEPSANDSNSIMISYCHEQKHVVQKLLKELRRSGVKNIWIDAENMHKGKGIIETMTEAVNSAKLLICCISNDYKDSRNCMKELKYATTLNKTIVPVVVEKNFVPEGVLLMCIEDSFRFDLSTDDTFGPQYQKLLEALADL
ncbi:uncharacterized protein LOC134851218 [Symsagittifera roscoffensis]|uniref:uncharacterized protein LOC134851218 n=1 Tax=Symsagittifera roscoffensis TaxID=84072 RepID=UPI00307CBB51